MRIIARTLLCKHSYEFVRNIYGDEIRYLGWKRSIWKCTKCGNIHCSNELINKTYDSVN